jgi:hypothetical protein
VAIGTRMYHLHLVWKPIYYFSNWLIGSARFSNHLHSVPLVQQETPDTLRLDSWNLCGYSGVRGVLPNKTCIPLSLRSAGQAGQAGEFFNT